MYLVDLSHTSHTQARTGIQQVCRGLYHALDARGQATPITHDPYRRLWRPLAGWERANLSNSRPGKKRGAKWPWWARLGSFGLRNLGSNQAALPASNGLLVPEVFLSGTAAALPRLFAHVQGPRLALFHDAIALRLPEMSPPKTVSRFPSYLQELLLFDGIAAVSEESRQSLVDYWTWLGAKRRPLTRTIPLPLLKAPRPTPDRTASPSPSTSGPVVLSVGTIEGRKNHLALLNACEALWARGVSFELRLIGIPQTQTGAAALARLDELRAAGRPLRYDGAVDDAALEAAYRECLFTVYPSLSEGFGLPVLESLAHGKPCVCSGRGALGESAAGGGCLTLDDVDEQSLARGLARLLQDSVLLGQFRQAAQSRSFRNWDDYLRDLDSWVSEVRASLPR